MRSLVFGLVVLLAGACGADEEPFVGCGDGVCDTAAGENGMTCDEDCYWDDCWRCPEFTVCAYHACHPAPFGSGLWVITMSSAHLPDTHPDSSPWDPDGLPDPYVTVTHNGTAVLGMSPVVFDTLDPRWNAPLPATQLQLNDTLDLAVFDEDGGTSEPVIACTVVLTNTMIATAPGIVQFWCAGSASGSRIEVRLDVVRTP